MQSRDEGRDVARQPSRRADDDELQVGIIGRELCESLDQSPEILSWFEGADKEDESLR